MRQPIVHVRLPGGRTLHVPLKALGVTPRTDERRLREALASYLEIGVGRLDSYILDRHPNGNLVLRPQF
jgi:hypothetical protein